MTRPRKKPIVDPGNVRLERERNRLPSVDPDEEQTTWLVELRSTSSKEVSGLFTVFLSTEKDCFVEVDGRLAFVQGYDAVERLHTLIPESFVGTKSPAPTQVYCTYCLGHVVDRLLVGEDDADSMVLDFLNFLLDLVRESQIDVSYEEKKALIGLADVLTISSDLVGRLDEMGIERASLVGMLFRLTGEVLEHAEILG